LPFLQAFQLYVHEGPQFLAGFEYAIALLNVSRDGALHCNTCVIADFEGITEVLKPQENGRGRHRAP